MNSIQNNGITNYQLSKNSIAFGCKKNITKNLASVGLASAGLVTAFIYDSEGKAKQVRFPQYDLLNAYMPTPMGGAIAVEEKIKPKNTTK